MKIAGLQWNWNLRLITVRRAARTRFGAELLPPRLAPAPPHHHAGRHQRSSHGIGGDSKSPTELGQCRTVAVQVGCCRYVVRGQSLVAHLHTVAVQDPDDAALAEVIALPEFRR